MSEHVGILQNVSSDPYGIVASTISTQRQSKRLLVLLLEDEPLIAMDLEMTLESAGFQVINLMSCEGAQTWLDRNTPDLVIVDIGLRDGQCTDVASRLVQANVPFIVHSGDHPGGFTDTPFALGAWVTKPAAADDFTRAAWLALDKSRSSDVARAVPI